MKKSRVSEKNIEKIDPYIPEAYSLQEQGRITRREFLRVSTVLGMSAGVATVAAACGAVGQSALAGEEAAKAGSLTSYLIVATYNHAAYKRLEASEPEGRIEARATAVRLFGRRVPDQGDTYDYGESGTAQIVRAEVKLTDFFTFADAFPYLPIADGDSDVEKEHKRASYLYGWVGIVPDDEKLSSLKEFIGWPDSPFCKMFDIQVSEIKPLEGNTEGVSQGLKLGQDEEAWEEKGFDIYDEQTPAMWR